MSRAGLPRLLGALLEYLLGFLALAVFATVAFTGGPPSEDRMVRAFQVGAVLAAVEAAMLLARRRPANRLILGANLWLMAGGLAAFTQQWWWLRGYQRLGESSLFLSMLIVGVLTTAGSPAGFVATPGPRRAVARASGALLLAVLAALAMSVQFRGNVQWAAVLPVIALSWTNRLLSHRVRRATLDGSSAAPPPTADGPLT